MRQPWQLRPADFPIVRCLCGSTRFGAEFEKQNWLATLEGKIVLSIGVLKHGPTAGHLGELIGPEVAEALDKLHLRKIDLADEVFVLNVGGYIGDSTRAEIAYAKKTGKPIEYLEPTP